MRKKGNRAEQVRELFVSSSCWVLQSPGSEAAVPGKGSDGWQTRGDAQVLLRDLPLAGVRRAVLRRQQPRVWGSASRIRRRLGGAEATDPRS